jgi:hypothetical protein
MCKHYEDNPEARKKKRVSMCKRYADPEARKKQSFVLKEVWRKRKHASPQAAQQDLVPGPQTIGETLSCDHTIGNSLSLKPQ